MMGGGGFYNPSHPMNVGVSGKTGFDKNLRKYKKNDMYLTKRNYNINLNSNFAPSRTAYQGSWANPQHSTTSGLAEAKS